MNKRIFATKIGGLLWKVLRFVILVGLSYVILYPVIYMVSMALRSADQTMDPSVVWVPKYVVADNFIDAMQGMKMWKSMGTTLVISLVSAMLQLVSCSLVGYGFARFKFKGSGVLFTLCLLTLIVPAQCITIPLYFQYQNFSIPVIAPLLESIAGITIPGTNLLDSWLVFWLQAMFGLGIRGGLYIYIFRQFFLNIPYEIEEAALVDGAGYFKTFYRIMMPNASGSYLTVFLFSIVWYWNDTFNSNMFITRKSTFAKALSSYVGKVGNGVNSYEGSPKRNAACVLVIAPLLLIYMFLQKFFVQGVERTGIVG